MPLGLITRDSVEVFDGHKTVEFPVQNLEPGDYVYLLADLDVVPDRPLLVPAGTPGAEVELWRYDGHSETGQGGLVLLFYTADFELEVPCGADGMVRWVLPGQSQPQWGHHQTRGEG